MDKFYHFTNLNCVYDINRNGLVPSGGGRCLSIKDTRSGVFLSKGIINSIIMYSYMLGYYQKCNGDEGEKDRQYIVDIIKQKETSGRQMDKFLISEYQKNIDRIDWIRNCGSFFNYLGGYGCFLSINEIDDIDSSHPEDCCYEGSIPSSKISVVNIVNKFTGEYICDREAVLSYFMSLYSPDYLYSLVPEDNKNDITNLYNYITGYTYYNPYNFDLCEIPITCYFEESKEKVLTNS